MNESPRSSLPKQGLTREDINSHLSSIESKRLAEAVLTTAYLYS